MQDDYCAPVTSFDWNEQDPNILGVSCIDTTCTIWNIETNQALWRSTPSTDRLNPTVKTKLIAHDKEVYDMAFNSGGAGKDQFASVGHDGSVRLFDLRNLDHSTIIYESDEMTLAEQSLMSQNPVQQVLGSYKDPHVQPQKQHKPLARLAWNKQDPNYIATMPLNSPEIIILDIRYPCTPLTRLHDHKGCVNDLAWAPHSSCHICTAGNDSQALIWDISQQNHDTNYNRGNNKDEPILAYQASGEINKVHWSQTQTDWIAIAFGKTLEILRV